MLTRLAGNGKLRIFALDRITALELTKVHYVYPTEFNPMEFFEPYFGIVALTGEEPEMITLRIYDELRGYLQSLPLHYSQKIVEEGDGYTTVTLNVAPTFDFIQEILSHREQIEVVAPEALRKELYDLITKMKNRYEDSDTKEQ